VPAYYGGDVSKIEVDVQGRPAAILASPGMEVIKVNDDPNRASFFGHYTGYFYVPDGTDDFTFGYEPYGTQTVTGTLTDAEGGTHAFNFVGSDINEIEYSSPVSGLWKIAISITPSYGWGYFWFTGIPPLVWNDPEYLLVVATGPAAPPVLSNIGNKTAGMGQQLLFTVFANDPNGDHLTYSASNLPPWATFNAVTRTFSGTPSQTGTYPSVHFQVSDGTQQDSEDITINVVVFQPDINNDGFVNVLDIIDTVQHWYQNGPDGWIIQDINFDGTVNILDLMQIVQHWTG